MQKLVAHHWHITAGVPSRLIQDFATKNGKLLHPDPSSLPKSSSATTAGEERQTTASAQALELSGELDAWIDDFLRTKGPVANGAVSMFNLLSFAPGMKSSYLKYGEAFASSIGSSHGGNAKIVGSVVSVNNTPTPKSTDSSSSPGVTTAGEVGGSWDEIALAHYPSIAHFREMLVSGEYQSVNQRYRVPSLRDTAILMTSEIAVEELLGGDGGGGKARL